MLPAPRPVGLSKLPEHDVPQCICRVVPEALPNTNIQIIIVVADRKVLTCLGCAPKTATMTELKKLSSTFILSKKSDI
jgi:hypothetical protein